MGLWDYGTMGLWEIKYNSRFNYFPTHKVSPSHGLDWGTGGKLNQDCRRQQRSKSRIKNRLSIPISTSSARRALVLLSGRRNLCLPRGAQEYRWTKHIAFVADIHCVLCVKQKVKWRELFSQDEPPPCRSVEFGQRGLDLRKCKFPTQDRPTNYL